MTYMSKHTKRRPFFIKVRILPFLGKANKVTTMESWSNRTPCSCMYFDIRLFLGIENGGYILIELVDIAEERERRRRRSVKFIGLSRQGPIG